VRVLLTGSAGMLGRSFREAWEAERPGDTLVALTRDDVDLRDPRATLDVLRFTAPDVVVHTAAKVGGIAAKLAHPTTYLLDNLRIDSSVIGAAIELGVPELLNIGSAAVYPEQYERPYVESDLLTGQLEPANEGYALAKIASTKLCAYAARELGLHYRVAVPSNLYGPHDHFASPGAHLVAAALDKVHRAHVAGAPSVSVWGDGTARREFTYAVDLAEWLTGQVGRLSQWPELLNLGCGTDHSVREYYEAAQQVVGYEGTFTFDTSKPSGVPRRLIDSSAAQSLGWDAPTSLADGMAAAYAAYLQTR
jgi:GDP-L-fucose synthase